MRNISNDYISALKNKIQTFANDNAPYADIRISRPNIVLTDDYYLESQKLNKSNISAVDIAVEQHKDSHQRINIYIAYIENGTLKIAKAEQLTTVSNQIFVVENTERTCVDCAICFDGYMPTIKRDKIKFVTKGYPYYLYVTSDGACKVNQLYSNSPDVVLAQGNCTKVSAVRSTISEVGSFDFGLIAFMLLNGSVYYRQLIDGVWYDAQQVTALPNKTFVDFVVCQTADFRTVLQVITTEGEIYQLFSQFQGIGKKCAEYINIKDIAGNATLTTIRNLTSYSSERIELDEVVANASLHYYGQPDISVENIPVAGDYGKKIKVSFSDNLIVSTGNEIFKKFRLVDSEQQEYYPYSSSIENNYIYLLFADINNAVGVCTVEYEGTTLQTVAEYTVDVFSAVFTPSGLEPSEVGNPEVTLMYNTSTVGEDIYIEFDKNIYDATDNEEFFEISFKEYDYIPGGALRNTTRSVISTEIVGTNIVKLNFENGNSNSIQNAFGDITVKYKGGKLYGDGGEVKAFEVSFTPSNLIYLGGYNTIEHIEVNNVTGSALLTYVNYINNYSCENISITAITGSATLTSIGDL